LPSGLVLWWNCYLGILFVVFSSKTVNRRSGLKVAVE
jgi:hypothetical protein